MTTCDLCGFVYERVPVVEIAGRVRSLGSRFQSVTTGTAGTSVRRRPTPATWSALEYLCHVRDVLLVQRERVVLAQVEDCPSVVPMHRDERVTLCRYDAQGSDVVLGQIAVAAELLALAFDQLSERAWQRALRYNWPQPATRDLAWLGRNVIHEGEHHLTDVERVLNGVAASP